MKGSSFIIILFCYLLVQSSSTWAFNITKILSEYPDYSTFNELLTKAGLANQLNSRSTITLLAVPNGAIGDLSSKSEDVLKRILSTHVVLDYYDSVKLKNMKDKTAKLTNMFQQSGQARNDQGFLNVTTQDGNIVFGSAVKGAQHDSKLDKSVMNQPYNISVLGISQPIVTPGIDGTLAPFSAPSPKANAPSPSNTTAQSPADEEAESPDEEAESPEEQSDAPSPSDDDSDSPAPKADSPPADAQAPAAASAGKLKISFAFFIILASMLAAY